MKLLQRLTSWAELDTRSLAAFRITLGLCLTYDLLIKLIYAKDFYSDWGLMPRTYWIAQYMNKSKISLMLANGESWFQYAFVLIALICAICFTIGYKTRLFQILAVVLLGSIHSRNYLVLSCADDLLKLGLFWSLLLPLDEHYALKKTAPQKADEFKIQSIGAGLFILQLVIMYIVTAFYKLNPVWTEEHSAIYYALNIDHFTTNFGKWLGQFHEFGKLLTETTLIWEFVGPILLFVPLLKGRLRTFVAAGFIFFHFGLALCLNLGTFAWVAMAYWGALLPGAFWQKIFGKFAPRIQTKLFPSQTLSSASSRPRKNVEWAFLILMVLVLLQNIADLTENRNLLPATLRKVVTTLNLNQVWDMFAPYPIRNDGWFIVEGTFKNGETRDIITGAEVTFKKPDDISNLYPTSEWRKFYLIMWDEGKQRILLPYSRYLCRSQISQDGLNPLTGLKITFMKETTPKMGEPFAEISPVELWSHDCLAP